MYINDKLYVNITYIKERRRTQSLARNISSYVLKHNHCWIIILIYLFPVFLMKIIIKVRYLFVILSFERHIIVKIRKKSVNDHLKKYIIIKIFTETISCFRIEFVKASTHRLRSSSPSAPTVKLKFVCPVNLKWLITSETEKGFRGKSSRTGVAVVAYVASWSNTVLIDRRQALLGVKPLLRRSKYKSPWLHYEYIYVRC